MDLSLLYCVHMPAIDRSLSACRYAGHMVMFPSGWGMFDLNPDPVNAGAHMIVEDPPQGRQMIYGNFDVASQAGFQHDVGFHCYFKLFSTDFHRFFSTTVVLLSTVLLLFVC